jgi:tRNA A37 N6-isopentenylltransferase MiaA
MPADLTIRKALNQRLKESGIEALATQLARSTLSTPENGHQKSTAGGACLGSLPRFGQTFFIFHTPRLTPRKFDTLTIGLEMDRSRSLIERINERVDAMVNAGMKNEAAACIPNRI